MSNSKLLVHGKDELAASIWKRGSHYQLMHSSSMHEPFNWMEDEAKKLTFVHMMCTIIAFF